MATYQAPFVRDAISEVVPRALELSSLSKSSLLTGRRRVRVIPQTGQTYGAASGSGMIGSGSPTLANILLQDSAGLLDMQSVVLSMNIKCQTTTTKPAANAVGINNASDFVNAAVNPYVASLGASGSANGTTTASALPISPGAAGQAIQLAETAVLDLFDDNDPLVTSVLDDFAWSVFRRIQISLNSQLVDDLDYCGRRATTEVYMSASPSWYDTIGTIMGAWKYVTMGQEQPLIVAAATPASGVATAQIVTVATIPIKSRVRSHIFAGYVPGAAVVGQVSAAGAAAQVVPFVNSGAIEQSNGSLIPGQLQAAGRPYASAGVGAAQYDSSLSANPLALSPQFGAAVSRTDVLSKLYNTSIFMKNVFYSPAGTPVAGQRTQRAIDDNPYLLPGQSTVAAQAWKPATAGSDAGPKFSIPLGMLSHLFRQEQLFPLRNAGQLILQIQFADALEAVYAGWLYPLARQADGGGTLTDLPGFAAPGSVAVSYLVQNLELECDIVTAIPEYTAILDAICSRPADKGLAIAFDSHLTSLQQVSGLSTGAYGQALGGSNSTQSFTLIASKGSENVRSFHWTFSPTQGLRNPFYLQNSTFPCYNINQWQIRVGSVYYPAFPSKGLSKNYMEMLSSMNAPMASIGQASVINYNMFRSSTPSPQWYLQTPTNGYTPAAGYNTGTGNLETWRYDPAAGVFSNLNNVDGAGQLVIDPTCEYLSDAYVGGYCFDNLKHAEPLSHDGIDTRAIAGGMIQLDFTCQPLEAFAVIFHIRFTRTIVLAENGVSIVG